MIHDWKAGLNSNSTLITLAYYVIPMVTTEKIAIHRIYTKDEEIKHVTQNKSTQTNGGNERQATRQICHFVSCKSFLINIDFSFYCISLHFSDTMFLSTLRQSPSTTKRLTHWRPRWWLFLAIIYFLTKILHCFINMMLYCILSTLQ